MMWKPDDGPRKRNRKDLDAFLGRGVAAAPHVRVVRVERLAVGQARQRLRAQLLEHAPPPRKAAAKLRGRVGLARPVLEPLALKRAAGGPEPPGVGA